MGGFAARTATEVLIAVAEWVSWPSPSNFTVEYMALDSARDLLKFEIDAEFRKRLAGELDAVALSYVDLRLNALEWTILKTVAQSEPMTRESLADKLGHDPKTVRPPIDRLLSLGLICDTEKRRGLATSAAGRNAAAWLQSY